MPISKDPVKRAKQIAQLKRPKKGDKGTSPGRPINALTDFVKKVKEQGYQIPSKDDIRTAISFCTGQTEEELKQQVTNKDNPMLIRIMAKKVLSDKGYDATFRMIENVYGKSLDITTNGKELTPQSIQVEVITKASEVDKKDE